MFMAQLHGHLSVRVIRARHWRDGVELKDLLSESNYDFNYQETKMLKNEVKLYPVKVQYNTLQKYIRMSNRYELRSIQLKKSNHLLSYHPSKGKLTLLYELSILYSPDKAHSPIFRGKWGTRKRQRSLSYVKSPPRSNQHQITYLSSCLVWKPALSSALSAVPSRSRSRCIRRQNKIAILTNQQPCYIQVC